MLTVHATCVAVGEAGVLLRGPSGSGKSDLALRLIDTGARLVADDRVVLSRDGDSLRAAPPPSLKGRLEVRGIGICDMAALDSAVLDSAVLDSAIVALAVDLVGPDTVERLPQPAVCEYLGITLCLTAIAPFEASAAAKVRLAVAALNGNSRA